MRILKGKVHPNLASKTTEVSMMHGLSVIMIVCLGLAASASHLGAALADGEFGTFPISPRGAFGRTDSITSVDVRADYSIHLMRNQQITFGLDVFNLFNSQGVTDVFEVAQHYEQDLQLTPEEYFLDPIGSQPSRSFRLLLRYSF